MPYSKKNPDHRCTAMCRSRGDRCRNAPAYGCKTCRYHGARKPNTIVSGEAHHKYKHGERTKAAMAAHAQSALNLVELENLAFNAGLIRTRIPGRKPG